MSPDSAHEPRPDAGPAPVELGFGPAFERLQEITERLGADETIAPERLIELLREGKGLERALREHLDRVEQEVRAIEDGEGATVFRITDPRPDGAPDPARAVSDSPTGSADAAAPALPGADPSAPASPPRSGGLFPAGDDDIPF